MHRAPIGPLLALLLAGLPGPAVRGQSAASENYPQVIAAEEIRLDAMLPSSPAHDVWGTAIGNADGEICALTVENFRLRSALSVDGGVNFATEIEVAGGTGQPDIVNLVGDSGTTGEIYVALQIADPDGHFGLQVVRSTDFCETWSSPTYLVRYGYQSYPVTYLANAANDSGRWAVYYHGAGGEDAFVTTSSDGGQTWTSPVRLDVGPPPAGSAVLAGTVAVDAAGIVYAAFVENNAAVPVLRYTRSTDGGLTFEASRTISTLLPASGGETTNPQLVVTADGSVLLTFWDSLPRIYVARSIDQGQSFTVSYLYDLIDPNVPLHPRLFTNAGDAYLLHTDESSRLALHRSLNNGQDFLFRELVTTTAYDGDDFAMARTPAGKWVLAWADNRDDGYTGVMSDIWAKTSPNRGDSWSLPQRVNSDTAGTARRRLSSLTPHGTGDDLLVTYIDDRDSGNEIGNLYGNRGTAGITALTLSPDQRIDTDADEATSPPVANIPALTTDGVDHVYVAFSADVPGDHFDVYVAASADEGRTFSTPVRVGDTAAGEALEWFPALAALPDGHVYLAYLSDDPAGTGREIRFNRSTDFGASWEGDEMLGALDWPAGFTWTLDWPALQIAALPDGKVHLVASDGSDVHLASWTDYGASVVATEDIDQDVRGQNYLPRICANGDQIVVAYVSPRELDDSARSIWGVVSEDAGETWATRQELRSPGRPGNIASSINLACGPGGRALASWSEVFVDTYRIHSRLYTGTSWEANDLEVPTPSGAPSAYWPSAAFANSTQVVLSYQVSDHDVYLARSIDGGVSWLASPLRLDEFNPAPDPPPLSFWPQAVSDGDGNVWVSWLDTAAGRPSVVMRRSADGGSSFFGTTRLDRREPQGAYDSFYLPTFGAAAALPGVGLVVWAGIRDNPVLYDVVLNGWDKDDYDRDGADDSGDCSILDPGAFAIPPGVDDLSMFKSPAGQAELSWGSLASAAGNETGYDVVSGRLSDLSASGGFDAASCLENDRATPDYSDDRSDPPSDDGEYYLIRGQNGCGHGTFGDSTVVPDPRDQLDDFFTPCP